jgi:hypothetical protein
MSLSRIDTSAVGPALDGVAALAAEPGAGVLAAAEGLADALLAQPSSPVDVDEPPVAGWLALRRDEDGVAEITAWRESGETAGAPGRTGPAAPEVGLHAVWRDGARVIVTLQTGRRTWSTLVQGAEGPGRLAPGGEGAAAAASKDWTARARRVRRDWDRENHPPRGWTCVSCGWENEADAVECGACRGPGGTGSPEPPASAVAAVGVVADGASAVQYAADEPPPILASAVAAQVPVGEAEVDVGPLLDGLLEEGPEWGLVSAAAAVVGAADRVHPTSPPVPPPVSCAACGNTDHAPGARFCRRCGTRLPAPG